MRAGSERTGNRALMVAVVMVTAARNGPPVTELILLPLVGVGRTRGNVLGVTFEAVSDTHLSMVVQRPMVTTRGLGTVMGICKPPQVVAISRLVHLYGATVSSLALPGNSLGRTTRAREFFVDRRATNPILPVIINPGLVCLAPRVSRKQVRALLSHLPQ